jgi:hypothetical protein
MRKILIDFVPGLVGAALAGVAGFFIVSWISQQGYYAPVIPGALAGLACGFLSVTDSKIRGILCLLIAGMSGLVAQWKLLMRRFETDGSFLDFLAHLHTETPITLIMIALGTFLGFWWGRESTCPWRDRFRGPAEPE